VTGTPFIAAALNGLGGHQQVLGSGLVAGKRLKESEPSSSVWKTERPAF
jgi:hypothetical protein